MLFKWKVDSDVRFVFEMYSIMFIFDRILIMKNNVLMLYIKVGCFYCKYVIMVI